MFQSWNQISFLHWQYGPDVLRSRLPVGLELDLFGGQAWLSLTPFVLENLRPSFLPRFPGLSKFPETNIRTYVQGPAGPGIWFFSLDAARLAAVVGARAGFGLPYFWSKMEVLLENRAVQYCTRRNRSTSAEIIIEPDSRILKPDPLSQFLTERYQLYAMHLGRLITVVVDHEPWTLRSANLLHLQETLRESVGLKGKQIPDLIHFSSGVDVRIAFPRNARTMRRKSETLVVNPSELACRRQ
jgi:uncharacterized protein YqjF (DUF2071 family)